MGAQAWRRLGGDAFRLVAIAQQPHSAHVVTDDVRRRLLMAWMGELRVRHGTDVEIARRSGINTSRLSRWARGDMVGGITLANLVKLAEVSDQTLGDMLIALYGVDPEDLLPSAPTALVVGSFVSVAQDRVVRLGSGRYRLLLLLEEPQEPPAEDG